MIRVYIATTNQGKLRDFAGAAAGSQIAIIPVPVMAKAPPPIEDGDTFEANARKKAEYYSRLLPGELVLADDSGLEVEALSGAPGVHSARYAALVDSNDTPAHSNSTDAANNARLLQELEGIPDERRTARFICVLAAARDGSTVLTTRGEVTGVILRQPRGTLGFGYDPLFHLPELDKTAAELTPEEKAKVSHRGQAFRNFLNFCQALQPGHPD
jgi:XTP/dITP diphosphohydrolase